MSDLEVAASSDVDARLPSHRRAWWPSVKRIPVFQGEIRLFFPSIDHEILFARLARRVWDPRVMDLAASDRGEQ